MFIEASAFSKDNVETAFKTLLNAISEVEYQKLREGINNENKSR